MENKQPKRINCYLFTFTAVASVVLLMYLCPIFINRILIKPIDADDVEQIIVYYNTTPYVLDKFETDKFIEIYNSSKYLEKDNGQIGTTPVYHTVIFFEGRDYACVSDYEGGKFAVSSFDSDFFVYNKELLTFLSDAVP